MHNLTTKEILLAVLYLLLDVAWCVCVCVCVCVRMHASVREGNTTSKLTLQRNTRIFMNFYKPLVSEHSFFLVRLYSESE